MEGLTTKQAERLLEKHGKNVIEHQSKDNIFKIFLRQYTDVFSLLLIGTAILSLVLTILGHSETLIDFYLIFGILVINGIIGTFEEYKAEKTLEHLKDMQKTIVRVIRDGDIVQLDSKYLVPKDVVLLEEGDKISFDGKIIQGGLRIDESSYSGEAYPQDKKKDAEVFSGTFVQTGSARALVQNTGTNTKFGELSKSVASMKELSFFKNQLSVFTRNLLQFVVVVVILFFGIGLIQGNSFTYILLSAVALGVAIVPEGLATTTVITLMAGINSLSKNNVLVRKLDSVEVLGAIDYIVSDKTGTLTKGDLGVYSVRGHSDFNSQIPYFALPNSKDPIDIALTKYAKEKGIESYGTIEKIMPFNYETRSSGLVWKRGPRNIRYVKGSPEEIFKLTQEKIDAADYLKKGFRTIAFAKHENSRWTLLGIVAFMDPIREDAKEAIEIMNRASIKPILVTGDHKITAKYVSEQIGLGENYISGKSIDEMSESEIYSKIKDGAVVYRALPKTKMNIISSLQSKSRVVLATGDGVNDTLLLKKADVGIAMGIRGTDVAKEASDIVLLDDSLKSIVLGIIQGRGIIKNVRKFITFLLSCNVAEAVANLLFPFLSAKVVLDAPKLLWINLITDGLPAISFGVDKTQDDVIYDKPSKYRFILEEKMRSAIVYVGAVSGILVAILFFISDIYFGFESAVTITFSVLIFSELLRAFVIRDLFEEKYFANIYFVIALIASFILQLVLLFTPAGVLFGLVSLGLIELAVVFIVPFIFFGVSKTIVHFIR